ncbi:MAG: Crp/Fnr family transcriptional regulator [Paludibacteraceae bacterium]|nr:Crp/Fnr family transcriptional regulator [Paludibacteraceae bacterium]MBR5972044.1 Crp/Fnr family transcriptional regulator [Paludibacteraceae bacterium]
MEKGFYERIFKCFNELPAMALSEDSVKLLNSKTRVIQLNKGEYLQLEGDVSRFLGIVDTGLIRIFYRKAGEEMTEYLASEDEIFYDCESFFRQTPSKRYIQMLEPSVLYLCTKTDLDELCKQNKEIRIFYRNLTEQLLRKKKQKTLDCIFEPAKVRYDNLINRNSEYVLRVPSIFVASYLGVTPETLSRIRSKVK